MNSNQKLVMILGLVAIAATTFVAPYRYTGRWAIGSILAGRSGYADNPVRGTLYLSVWTSRTDVDVRTAIQKHEGATKDYIEHETLDLNPGLLALWWAAIAMVTTVAVFLTKDASEG